MTTQDITPARAGRERSCAQCGGTFRSIRSNAKFCSTPCRKKAGRGTAPSGGPKAGPEGFSVITKALLIAGYVGPISPAHGRSKEPPVYALTVPFEHALDDLSYNFNRKGWGLVGRDEFTAALKSDGILGFDTRSPEALERNRYRARQRERMKRAK